MKSKYDVQSDKQMQHKDAICSSDELAHAQSIGYPVSVPDARPSGLAENVRNVKPEKRESKNQDQTNYSQHFFSPHQFETLSVLCELVIPSDHRSGGAIEAKVPEFIDFLTSENKSYQLQLIGGLMWLDSFCLTRCGHVFIDCEPSQQTEVIDLISRREIAMQNPTVSHGVRFFTVVRKLTVAGFFTSEIGIADLAYIGNAHLNEFVGCPAPMGQRDSTKIMDCHEDKAGSD